MVNACVAKNASVEINFKSKSPRLFFWEVKREIDCGISGIRTRGLRACLQGGGGPQVGEVTRLGGGNPPVHIFSNFNLITFTC